ncbi:CBS domain-containing protein [Haloparvum sedimenti]|uniref:CBS domain-containing protein n=1 Tax=Haloparvum sedimenti TaxID=1678448 RepID=UPI00071E7F45|nr:CBS domain-containing protein [Haloparvum sedimenti]
MRGITIGRLFDIPIKLNWTFLLVLPLFAYLIGSDVAAIATVVNETMGAGIDVASLEAGTTPWLIGLASALGLFAGVLVHEFGHSLVAMRYGYDIDSITLWLLGGMANFAELPEDWKQEFWIAVAGPITSVGVGVICYGLFLATPAGLDPLVFVFGYLAVLNVVLAVFNMLPAFPMDGGRVLRALLARGKPHAKATQQAAEVGKVFAFLLGIIGLFSNLFLVLLAFFIYIAASGEAQQTTLKAAFQDVQVADVMTPREDLDVVSEETTVAELVDRMFRERHTGYPVLDGDDLVGLVTLEDAREVREVERDAYEVAEIMERDIKSVTPDTDAMEALRLLQEHGVGRLPVIDANGNLVGLVSRTDLMTAFNVIQTGGRPASLRQRVLPSEGAAGSDDAGPLR